MVFDRRDLRHRLRLPGRGEKDRLDQKIDRKPYSPEFRERAVRLFMEHRPEHPSEGAALGALAEKLRRAPDSLGL